MSSSPARPNIEEPAGGPGAANGIPRVFVLGVVMMVVVVGGLMLSSVLAAVGDTAPPPATGMLRASSSATHSPTLAPTATPGPYLGLTGYVWPLVGATITLPFGPSVWGEFFVDGQRFHDGVDMATACGDPVRAAHDGTVLAASRQYDDYMGWIGSLAPYYSVLDTKHWWNSLPIVIVIDDGDGYRSIYAHEYKVTVAPGQHVKAGQVIGFEGQTGNASGCHVHFGLFSPAGTAAFQLDPAIVAADQMPAAEIARINPLLVLPFRCEFEEMRALRPVEAAPCPVFATPSADGTGGPSRPPSAAPTGVGVS